MKKMNGVLSLVLLLLIGFFLGAQMKNSNAQEAADFHSVVPFMTNGGFFGLFDQSSGMLYLYDGKLQRLVTQAQFTELGQPPIVVAQKLRDETQNQFEYQE
jgi:hypothetical protein